MGGLRRQQILFSIVSEMRRETNFRTHKTKVQNAIPLDLVKSVLHHTTPPPSKIGNNNNMEQGAFFNRTAHKEINVEGNVFPIQSQLLCLYVYLIQRT